MKLHLCPLAALMSLAFVSPLSAAPEPRSSGGCNLIEVWVDPVHGTDPAPPQPSGPGIGHQ